MVAQVTSISSQSSIPAIEGVFNDPDLIYLILKNTQVRSHALVNRHFCDESQRIVNASWQQIQQDLTTKEAFQERHPTLSSFIRSGKITSHSSLVSHLRKEAHDLDLIETDVYRTFQFSVAPKDILALDVLIEKTNFKKANKNNFLWKLGNIELPAERDYQTWNEFLTGIISAGTIHLVSELGFCNLGLTRIPYGIFRHPFLRTLRLSDNKITTLPSEIGGLTFLWNLNLSNNQLTALPPEIGKLTALRTLELEHNQLIVLPPEIGALRALTSLNLGTNQLKALPSGIGELQALQELWLSRNQLTSLPPEIGSLMALSSLCLSRNRLKALLPEIGELTVLQSLDVENNQLEVLPFEILRLRRLRKLYLKNNKFTTLPESFKRLYTRLKDGVDELRKLIEEERPKKKLKARLKQKW